MYARDSRYRNVAAIARLDGSGRTLLTTDLRKPPVTNGRFQHIVESGERLDVLGQRYYRKPRKWWRICDANRDFQSPLALLGLEPQETVRLPVAAGGSPPPWPQLLAALRAVLGVEDVSFGLESRTIGALEVEVGVATVTYNRLNVSAIEVVDAATTAGFAIDAPETVGRVGKPITVPPDGNG